MKSPKKLDAELVSVFVPTTPNPTSGFLFMARRSDIRELDMSVDEALKYVISMGVVVPANRTVPAPQIVLPDTL